MGKLHTVIRRSKSSTSGWDLWWFLYSCEAGPRCITQTVIDWPPRAEGGLLPRIVWEGSEVFLEEGDAGVAPVQTWGMACCQEWHWTWRRRTSRDFHDKAKELHCVRSQRTFRGGGDISSEKIRHNLLLSNDGSVLLLALQVGIFAWSSALSFSSGKD